MIIGVGASKWADKGVRNNNTLPKWSKHQPNRPHEQGMYKRLCVGIVYAHQFGHDESTSESVGIFVYPTQLL